MSRWRRRAVSAVATVVVATSMVVVLPAGPAQAKACEFSGCSRVRNHDNLGVWARMNWTCDHGTTGTASTECGSGESKYLSTGAITKSGEDWDVLQVDAGWCYKVQFNNWSGRWTVRYDRRGRGNTYVKVENGSLATVLDQSQSGCP